MRARVISINTVMLEAESDSDRAVLLHWERSTPNCKIHFGVTSMNYVLESGTLTLGERGKQ